MELTLWTPPSRRAFPFDKPLKLIPLGDLHAGCDGFDGDRLHRMVKKAVADDCWFYGMGVYTDFASASNREKLIVAGLYETSRSLVDGAVDRVLDELKQILEPTRGRWLGMLEGNHYWMFEDGVTSDQALARYLGAPFHGTCGVTHVLFQEPPRRSATAVLWATHGRGGASTKGTILRKLAAAITSWDATVYMMGHLHQLESAKVDRGYTTHSRSPVLIAKPLLLVGTGSYLKGYQQGSRYGGRPRGSYVERAMYPMTSLGSPLVTLTAKEDRIRGHKYIYVDPGVSY